MSNIKFVVIALVTCLFSIMVSAKAHGGSYQHAFQLTASLNNSQVNAIVEDSSGYIWIGTHNGLYRVEGTSASRFVVDDERLEQQSSYISDLVMLNDQQMLVGTASSLYRLELSSGRFQRVDQSPFIGATITGVNNVLKLASNSVVAFGRESIHLIDFENQNYRRIDAAALGSQQLDFGDIVTAEIQGERLYFGLGGELYFIDQRNGQIAPVAEALQQAVTAFGRLLSMAVTADEQLWIGTSNGLMALDLTTGQGIRTDYHFPHPGGMRIMDIAVLDERRLALATFDGLVIYDRLDKRWSHRPSPQNQPLHSGDFQQLSTLFKDRHNILWVGGLGISQYLPAASQFTRYQQSGQSWIKPSSDIIWAAYQDQQQLWLSNNTKTQVFDLSSRTSTDLALTDSAAGIAHYAPIYAIEPLEQQVILGGELGLFLVDKMSLAVTPVPVHDQGRPLSNVVIYDVALESPVKVWLATNQGVFLWEPQSDRMHSVTAGMSLMATLFKKVEIDSQGRPWFATDKGVMMLDRQGGRPRFFFDHSRQRVDLNNVADIIELKPGLMLVSIYNEGVFGLEELAPEQFQIIDFNQQWQLPSKNSFVMAPLGEQQLLLGSDLGLIRVNLASGRAELFTQKDGFPLNHFNEAARYIDNHQVMLGTEQGLLIIREDAQLHLSSEAPTKLSQLVAYHENGEVSRQLGYDSHYQLKPGTRALALQFANMDFTRQAPVKVRYRLEPVSDRFIEILSGNKVMLTDLQPGRYQLAIQGMSNGRWQRASEEITIELQAWWWQTHIARMSAIIVLALLGLFLLQRKLMHLRYLRRVNRALLHSEEQLKLALWGSDNHMWSWYEDTNIMHINNLSEITGQGENSRFETQSWLGRIHPEDQARVKFRWSKFLVDYNRNYHCDYRISAHGNQWRWLRVTGKKTRLSGDALLRVTGTYSDITALKAMEDERSLLAHALESTNDAVLLFDDDKLIITANEAVKRLSGHDISRLKGRPLSLLFSETQLGEYTPFIQGLRLSGQWKGETLVRHADGREIAIRLSMTKINQESSGPGNTVAVFNDITGQKRIERELRQLTNYDSLTKLANRSLLTDRLEQAIAQAAAHEQKLALLFIDLDHFKTVNDSFGHRCGDRVLEVVAARLKQLVGSGDTVARFGGDEFVIVLPDIGSIDQASRLAESINSALCVPVPIDVGEAFVTPSIGVSLWPDDAREPQRLLKCADEAMSHAKEEGRNHFRFFSKARSEEAQYRLQLEHDLRYAIGRQQLSLYYQPQIDLRTMEIVGVEALLRWLHPQHGFISPGLFIPIAENGEQIFELSEWVLDTAVRQAKEWLDRGLSLQVSVNISAKHFGLSGFVEQILAVLEQHQLPPQRLCIEITEGMLMTDVGNPQQVIDELKTAGIAVSIDDFGSGYSSLSYLNNFPVTELKIDRSFISALDSQSGPAIVNSILVLGQSLGMTTVAEGIETREQATQLSAIGCNVAQGYYYSRPLPAIELWRFASTWRQEHGLAPVVP